MRVLYVNHTGRVSGGEHSLIGLLEAIPGGVEPLVACPEGLLAERLRERRIEVLPIRGTDGSMRLHPTRTPKALAEMAQAASQVRRMASRTGADLVHANSIRAGLVATAGVVGGGPPTVVHVRDCLPPGPVSALTLAALARADALIANSAYTRSRLGRAGQAAHVVHNAVDLSRFEAVELSRNEARRRLGLEHRGPVLAVVAQITPWKGQDDAIRIAAALAEQDPSLALLLVGSAKFDSAATRYDNRAFLESLRRMVSTARLEETVFFLGERDDIPELLAAVDVALVPSWEEPFGRSVIEAMAAGVPVLATDVGGPAELVSSGDGACGLILPPRQPSAWAEALRRLLADPSRLSRFGAQGRKAAKSFGLQRHAAEVLEIYEALAAREVGETTPVGSPRH